MNLFKRVSLWVVIGALGSGSLVAQDKPLRQAQSRPNIVLLYIDDWAWNGSAIAMNESMENSFMPILEMPNLEKLASQGMKFTNAYGSPQCAPACVCVQTGQSTPRNGYTLVLGKLKSDYYDTRPQYQKLPLVPNVSDQSIDAVYEKDPKLMFSITERAIGFIEEQANAGNPFYCQISHFAMHVGAFRRAAPTGRG